MTKQFDLVAIAGSSSLPVMMAFSVPADAHEHGKVMSGDIACKQLDVASVEGSKFSVNVKDGVKADEASVVKADIKTSNDVIHLNDQVVLPN